MKPKRINFQRVLYSSPAQHQKAVLTRGDGGPLKPKLKPIESPNVKAHLRELEAGERYEIEVTLSPPFETDRVWTNLELETGVAQAPTTAIPIYATIIPRVAANPRRITMPGNPQANWKQRLSLKWSEGTTHKITTAKVDDPKLRARVDERNEQQWVVLELAGDDWPAPGLRTITIETDDAEAPTVLVPLSIGRTARPLPVKRPALTPGNVQETKTKGAKAETTKPETTGAPVRNP